MKMFTSALLVSLVLTPTLSAQRFWLDPVPDREVTIVTTLGLFDEQVSEFPTLSLAGRIRVPVGERTILTGEIPLVNASRPDNIYSSESAGSTAIGNPWVGLEFRTEGGNTLELGFRPGVHPRDDSYTSGFGQYLDFDRWEAWFPKVTSVRGAARFGNIPQSGAFGSGRIGATGFLPRSGGSAEVFLDYGLRIGAATPEWIFWAGIIGHGVVTSSAGDFADRTLHQGELTVQKRRGGLRPILSVRKFVFEEFTEEVNLIVRLGLNLGG